MDKLKNLSIEHVMQHRIIGLQQSCIRVMTGSL